MRVNLRRLSVKSWGWKRRLVVAVVAILVILVVYIMRQANSPAVGTVAINDKQSTAPITDSTDYSTLNNEYFSLLYPSDLSPDFADQKPANTLAYNFVAKRDAAQNITASLEAYARPLPNGGVTLDADYHNYQSQPELYKLSQKFIRGEVIDVATRDKGVHERGAMWVHGKYLLIMKLKGADKDTLDTQFTTILKSIQWMKS
jgi:hypothetical protein